MRLTTKLLLAGAAAISLAACETTPGGYVDPRHPWEVTAWASKRDDGLYSVRTVTVATDTCYAPGEISSAPSTLAATIEVRANLIHGAGPCSNYLSDVIHDLPALRLEPDDRQIEFVIYADGAERNRTILNIENLQPITGQYYPRYDPRDPRFVPPR